MKKLWKFVGIAALVAILGAAAVGAVAFAQEAKDGSTTPFDFAAKFKEAIASILGISVSDYEAAVEKAQEQVVDEAVADGWLTQDQADLLRWRMEQAPGDRMPGMMGLGKGFGHRGFGGPGWGMGKLDGPDSLLSVAADKLGMKLTELLTELQNGKTIADVAKDKKVDTQTIVDAYVAQVKETLDKAVADGRITQKQADYWLEQVKTRATEQLDATWKGLGRGGRRGGMMGFPGLGGF